MTIVQVYRNLHRKCWSVRDRKTRRVVDRTDVIILADCTFKVSEAGRQRVLATGRKNVHAFVRGDRDSTRKLEVARQGYMRRWQMTEVTYDPRKGPSFVRKDTGLPVFKADLVVLSRRGVFAYGVS